MHRWPLLPGSWSHEDQGFDWVHTSRAVRETVRTSSASPASKQALGGAQGRDPGGRETPFRHGPISAHLLMANKEAPYSRGRLGSEAAGSAALTETRARDPSRTPDPCSYHRRPP